MYFPCVFQQELSGEGRKIFFLAVFFALFASPFTLEGKIKIFYNQTGVRGKGTHEKKKSLKMFKEDAKGGNKSLEDEKKLQMAGGLCAVSGICAVYVLL